MTVTGSVLSFCQYDEVTVSGSIQNSYHDDDEQTRVGGDEDDDATTCVDGCSMIGEGDMQEDLFELDTPSGVALASSISSETVDTASQTSDASALMLSVHPDEMAVQDAAQTAPQRHQYTEAQIRFCDSFLNP